eukprot:scaffold567_cov170-Amphora_coffeaeformis.AAC.1
MERTGDMVAAVVEACGGSNYGSKGPKEDFQTSVRQSPRDFPMEADGQTVGGIADPGSKLSYTVISSRKTSSAFVSDV